MRSAGFALVVGLVLAACNRTSSGAHGDAGQGAAARKDAGSGDAGKLVWHPDASIDSGVDVTSNGGQTALDSGLAGRECAKARMPLPSVLLPRCRASTRVCIAGCAGASDADACRSACLKADDLAPETTYGLDCQGCVYLQLFGCLDQGGCHDGVAEVFCCIEDKCPSGSPDNCGDQMCGNEIRAAGTCGYYARKECLDFLSGPINACFEGQSADEDAGSGS